MKIAEKRFKYAVLLASSKISYKNVIDVKHNFDTWSDCVTLGIFRKALEIWSDINLNFGLNMKR